MSDCPSSVKHLARVFSLSDINVVRSYSITAFAITVPFVLCLVGGCDRASDSQAKASAERKERARPEPIEAVSPVPIQAETEPSSRSVESDPALLRAAAIEALGNGQEYVAFDLVREVNRVAPDHPESLYLKALVLGERHRFHEAIKILDDLAVRTPATRLYGLGQTAEWLVLSGQYDEAESRFLAILKEAPNSAEVHRHLGQLLTQVGKRTEASEHLAYLSQIGEINQEELRSLLRRAKPFTQDADSGRLQPLKRLAHARSAFADDDPNTALETLDADGELSKEEASFKARINAEQENYDSVKTWASTQDSDPTDPDGWYALGALAANEENHAKAIRCFSNLLLIDQTDANAYQMFSRSLRAVGKTANADEADKRYQLIQQTHQIGSKLTNREPKDRPLIAELIVLLQQLNRPLEMFGWQGVDLVFAVTQSAMAERDAQATFEDIGRKREQLVQSGQHQADPAYILCGVDMSDE